MIPQDAKVHIEKYDKVIADLFTEHRQKFGSDLVAATARAKVNTELADRLSKTGIQVRPKWIADARLNAAMAYDKAHKVFTATNNLLKHFGFELIPDTAIVIAK